MDHPDRGVHPALFPGQALALGPPTSSPPVTEQVADRASDQAAEELTDHVADHVVTS